MSTLGGLYREGRRALAEAGVEGAAFEASCLMEKAFGLSRQQRLLRDGETADPAGAEKFRALVREREGGRPLQYILGRWPFCGMELLVGEGVLIPREETELLVGAAEELLAGVPAPRILDLCSGTGAVALALGRAFPKAEVVAAEWVPEAFAYLEKNCARFGAPNVRPARLDVLDPASAGGFRGLDCIVSNPPYVCSGELSSLQREVRREPREALDGGEDGLTFYRAVAKLWLPALRPGGVLCVECGEGQAGEAARLFAAAGLEEIRFRRDLGGIDRVVSGRVRTGEKE